MISKVCVLAVLSVVLVGSVLAADSLPEDKKVVDLINEIDKEKSVYLFGGLSVERSPQNGRSISVQSTGEAIVDRAIQYMNEHTLKFKVPEDDATVEGKKTFSPFSDWSENN